MKVDVMSVKGQPTVKDKLNGGVLRFSHVNSGFFFLRHGVGACPCLCEQKFQGIEEAHLRQMKQLIKGYSHSIEDTHVQVGQVCCSSR